MRIPVDTDHASMNLAHAVTVSLYELRRQYYRHAGTHKEPQDTPRSADLERMFGHLQDAFEAIHYVYGTKGEPLMHAIRHLIGERGRRRRR